MRYPFNIAKIGLVLGCLTLGPGLFAQEPAELSQPFKAKGKYYRILKDGSYEKNPNKAEFIVDLKKGKVLYSADRYSFNPTTVRKSAPASGSVGYSFHVRKDKTTILSFIILRTKRELVSKKSTVKTYQESYDVVVDKVSIAGKRLGRFEGSFQRLVKEGDSAVERQHKRALENALGSRQISGTYTLNRVVYPSSIGINLVNGAVEFKVMPPGKSKQSILTRTGKINFKTSSVKWSPKGTSIHFVVICKENQSLHIDITLKRKQIKQTEASTLYEKIYSFSLDHKIWNRSFGKFEGSVTEIVEVKQKKKKRKISKNVRPH